MKFKNLDNGSIIEVDINNISRIEKLKGYPDKFEVIEIIEETVKSENNKKQKKGNN